MFAVYAARFEADNPVAGLELGEQPEPEVPDGWTSVSVRAASLNHHDLWSLRGVGLRVEQLPMILGCDAAGIDADGNEVLVHSVIGDPDWRGDETLDPARTILSERHPGTFAERVAVPRRNVLPKPPELSFEEAACLPTGWLTAFRMLFTKANLAPGATALVVLGSAAGLRIWVTSRSPERRAHVLELGAEQVFEPGARLPDRVEAVMETVGAATWAHSIRSLKSGGTVVVSGATTGDADPAGLAHIYFRQLSVVGSTMGTLDELKQLLSFCLASGVRPLIEETLPLQEARRGFEALAAGRVFGKLVFVNA